MMIPLFLYEKNILSRPVFYLSGYLESHREEYVGALRQLNAPGNWNSWIDFFLTALIEQAAKNASKAREIIDLYEDLKKRVIDATRSKYAVPLLDLLFENMIFPSTAFDGKDDMPSKQMITIMLQSLKKARILKVIREGAGRRPQMLALVELINLCEGREVL